MQDSARSFKLHECDLVKLGMSDCAHSSYSLEAWNDESRNLRDLVGSIIGLSLIVLVGWRGPAWMNISDNGALLGDNIVRSWLLQTTRSRLLSRSQLRLGLGSTVASTRWQRAWLASCLQVKVLQSSSIPENLLEPRSRKKVIVSQPEDILSFRRAAWLTQ